MRLTKKTAIAVATLGLDVSGVWAAPASFCPDAGVCYSWAVPEVVASSGSGSIFFQLRAPANYSWIGLGIGSQMDGSDMFVMYADGTNNVTLSTRSTTGHVMPRYVPRADVQLVQGSGISGGQMVANVQCSGCSDLNLGGSTSWIAAWARGNPLNSKSMSEPITMHDGFDSFSVDLSKASIKTAQNPFADPNAVAGGDPKAVTGGKSQSAANLSSIHGILMTMVFVIGYPIGSALMPMLGKWMVHSGWQTITFFGMWAGFGIGYVISKRAGNFFAGPHTRLGVIVCVLFGLQPALGWLHHLYFVKHRKRGIISHVHIWYGRLIMAMGIITGGLGLKLGKVSLSVATAYSIVAILVTLLYIGAIGFRATRVRQMRDPGGPKMRLNSL